jgi:PAS domain S-box-containing protein
LELLTADVDERIGFAMAEDGKSGSGFDPLAFLAGGGEMGGLIRAYDWSATPLGPATSWSPALRTVIRLMLANRLPMLLWWGPQYISIYNDPYIPVLGNKHPWGLARPVSECWQEIWEVLKPLIDTPFHGGPATWNEDIVLVINRYGFNEETHWLIAYSPVPDETVPSQIGGVLATVHEVTAKVLSERRMTALRDLKSHPSDAKTAAVACTAAAATLVAHSSDIPFALLYLTDADGRHARLAATAGVDADQDVGAQLVDLDVKDPTWSLAEARQTMRPQIVTDLRTRLSHVPPGPWPDPPTSAVTLPIASGRPREPAGFLVAGVSSRLRLDDAYRGFLELVAAQIATTIGNARVYEEEKQAEAAQRASEERQTFLLKLSDALRADTSADGIGALATRMLAEHLAVDRCWISRFSRDKGLAWLGPQYHAAALAPLNGEYCLADFPDAMQQDQERSPAVKDVQNDPELSELDKASIGGMDVGAYMAAILSKRERDYIWSIFVAMRLPRNWSQSEMRLLEEVTERTWAAIERATAEAALATELDAMTRLRELSDRLLTAVDLPTALGEVLDTAITLHAADQGTIQVYDATADVLQFAAYRGFAPVALAAIPIIDRDFHSTCAVALRTGQRVVAADIRADPQFVDHAATAAALGYRAAISSLLTTRQGECQGVLTVQFRQPHVPTERELWLADLYAPLAAHLIERQRGADALRASEQRLRAMADQLPNAAVFMLDPELRYQLAAGNGLAATGLIPTDIEGKTLAEVVPAEAAAETDANYRRALAGEPFQVEHTSGGRHFVTHGAPLRDMDGTVTAALAVSYDITDRKRVEAELRDSEERFRMVADNMSQLAWTCDRLGNVTWYNKRWLDYTGLTFETMKGWDWSIVQHPDHLERVVASVKLSAETGEPWEDIFPLRGSDGVYRWFLSRALPIRDSEGRIIRWFGTNTDISEQRQLEQALKEADRHKDEFLATLAHELRNPLAPIRNGLQIMRLAPHDAEALVQARGMMERQLGHMVRLIDDLLDLNRVSRGKVELRQERVSLLKVIQQAVETSRPLIEAGRHDLTLDVRPDPIYVKADPLRLAQVFANLLNNAAKYTEQGGRVTLTLTQHGGQAVVSVRDNGVGIPAHMLAKIFDVFTQVERSLDKTQGGLGIGLSLVKKLVEMHGGSVEAKSEGYGMGSEFSVRLPVVPALAGEPQDEFVDTKTVPSPRRRILVVDDNRDSANSLSMLLRIMGNDAQTAHDGLEALDVGAAFEPDVILLDIGMPKLDGYETARRIRQQAWGKNVVLVAQTGWGQAGDKQRSQEVGFNFHMVKPVDPLALEKLLAGLQTEMA